MNISRFMEEKVDVIRCEIDGDICIDDEYIEWRSGTMIVLIDLAADKVVLSIDGELFNYSEVPSVPMSDVDYECLWGLLCD